MIAEKEALYYLEKSKEEWPRLFDCEGLECLIDELPIKATLVPAPKRLNFFQRLFKRIKEFFHGK